MKAPTHFILIAAVALACHSGAARADVFYVNGNAFGANNGSAWADAFTDLHDALTASIAGDEIWVAQGVYTPSEVDAAVSYRLKSGVALFGGFSGAETERSQRDWQANITNLSGDIGNDDVFNGTFWSRVGSNSGHVLDGTDTDAACVVDGFTISQGAIGPVGTISNSPLMTGGALYLLRGDATVRNCRILSNQGAFVAGGAVYVYDGSPEFDNCSFEYNSGHICDGGAMFTGGTGQPYVHDCVFLSNRVTFSSPDNAGGAWYNHCTLPITVERCRFENNRVDPFFSLGGVGYGGGFMSFTGGCTVTDCQFINNRAPIGGGMITWGPSTITNCLFIDNDSIEQPGSGGIDQGGRGGGLVVYSFGTPAVLVTNCTFTRNRADKGGGFYGISNGNTVFQNSILWDNIANNPDVAGYSRAEIAGTFDLSYCTVRGIFGPPELGEDIPDPEDNETNLDVNPLFINPAANDFRLADGSPVIDAGHNGLVPVGIGTDLDGSARFIDMPGVTDTGISDGRPVVDLGAYESQPATALCPGDCDMSGAVDFNDLVTMLFEFGNDPGDACDADENGTVDFNDLVTSLFLFGACP